MPHTLSKRPGSPESPDAPQQRYSREQQKAQRALRLLDSAWAMFCEKGYDDVTIEDVADHAGYSRQPVYTLFGDKQNLFFELWRRKVTELLGTLVGGLKPGAPLRQNLGTLAQVLAVAPPQGDKGVGERLFFVVQTIALSRPEIGEKIVALSREIVGTFAGIIRESTLGKGERLRTDPDTIAAHVIAHINGMATVQFQTQGAYPTQASDILAIFLAIALKNPND